MPPVTDERDIRTLIPRVRRALDGPHATSSGAPSSTFNDDEITAQIADAIAEVIFFAPDGFGKELIPTERDEYYNAPIAWITSEPLSEAEASVIVYQAALNEIYQKVSTLKTSESMSNEGEEWSWSVSSTAVAERVKALQKLRDEAIAKLDTLTDAAETAWVNTLAERDAYTDALIEPWLGAPTGGQEFEPRYF
jgi:hypothetical protein